MLRTRARSPCRTLSLLRRLLTRHLAAVAGRQPGGSGRTCRPPPRDPPRAQAADERSAQLAGAQSHRRHRLHDRRDGSRHRRLYGGRLELRDALYMVIITVFTVGYGEIRPINTPAFDAITISLIVFGCTGIIFLTGALVQLHHPQPASTRSWALKRMNCTNRSSSKGHVIVCGFGRFGSVLARSLTATSAGLRHPRRERSARRRGPPSGLSLPPWRCHQRGRPARRRASCGRTRSQPCCRTTRSTCSSR